MEEIQMPTHCVVCKKKFNHWKFWWEIEKWWLRRTEISLLWENCCSSKCYERLLEKLLKEWRTPPAERVSLEIDCRGSGKEKG